MSLSLNNIVLADSNDRLLYWVSYIVVNLYNYGSTMMYFFFAEVRTCGVYLYTCIGAHDIIKPGTSCLGRYNYTSFHLPEKLAESSTYLK